MANINMHMKFEIEIPKETWLMLRKPCRLQTDGRTDGQTDGRTRWIQYTPPPTSLGGGIITFIKIISTVSFKTVIPNTLYFSLVYCRSSSLTKKMHLYTNGWSFETSNFKTKHTHFTSNVSLMYFLIICKNSDNFKWYLPNHSPLFPKWLMRYYGIQLHFWVSFTKNGITLIPAWVINYTHYKEWDQITSPFIIISNENG